MNTYVKKGRCCVCGQKKEVTLMRSASALPRPQYNVFFTPFVCNQCLSEITKIEMQKVLVHCIFNNQKLQKCRYLI
jgi:hypothetical protein